MLNFSGEATTLSCPLLLSTGGTSAATSRVDLEHRVQPTRDQELVAKITTDVEKMMALLNAISQIEGGRNHQRHTLVDGTPCRWSPRAPIAQAAPIFAHKAGTARRGSPTSAT